MRDGFGTYHPIVNMIFYVAVIGIAMFVMHPFFIIASLLGAATYEIYLNKGKGIRLVLGMIPVFLLTSLINPLFSHRGMTLICYLPTGNPLTLESVLYGLATGLMIVTVILWFSTFHVVMTNDKILCLAGKIIPSVGMLISMVLRFVPKYTNQSRKVVHANQALGITEIGKHHKLKNGIKSFGIMATWSLENAVISADSMKARGYGAGRRTSFTTYRFDHRDGIVSIVIIMIFTVVVSGFVTQTIGCHFYPLWKIKDFEGNRIFVAVIYITYAILCFMPVIINIKEDMKWRRLQLKI